MSDFECPGLPADWINGWLAAVGVTVLDARIRLRWSAHDTPVAVLSAADVDPIDAIVQSWPDAAVLLDMPIAKDWRQTNQPMERKVHVDVFRQRARMARQHPHSWTLSSTMTDLQVDKQGCVEHALFDPAGPGSIKWLHHRLLGLHERLDVLSPQRVRNSLTGQAVREHHNGLGFDLSRLGSSADKTDVWVDPIVEVLAFFGLAILPMRAGGVDKRLDPRADDKSRQRGWRGTRRRTKTPPCFTWPAWTQPLDRQGIDALLDVWKPGGKPDWPRLGVRAGWQTVSYEGRGTSDRTNAFGAERL